MTNVFKKAIPLTVALTMMSSVPVMAYEKNETVYTKINSDGTVTYQMVNEHLTSNKKETIKDYSDLTDIKNTSGNEKMTQSGNDVTWQSKGSDIFYQGKTTTEIPVSVTPTYTIDGKKVSYKDAKGKKGHVVLTFDYKNNQKHQFEGKTVYTPFLCLLTTTFDSEKTKNLKVNNGKIINNGRRDLLVGVSLPGMHENYPNIKQFDDFNSIKIEYDTTDFDLSSLYSVASPKLLEEDGDINKLLDKVTDNFDKVDDLETATQKLVDGSSKLSSGAKTLANGTSTLSNGTSQLANGTSSLSSGAGKLSSGAKTLANGTSTLATGTAKLAAGAKTLATGANTLTGGAQKLAKGTGSLAKGTKSLAKGASSLSAGAKKVNTGAGTLAKGTSSLHDGTKKLATGASSLATGANKLAEGTTTYSKGLTTLQSGAKQLQSQGTKKVAEGAKQLNQSTAQLFSAVKSQASTLSTQLAASQTNLTTLKNFNSSSADKIKKSSDTIDATITELKRAGFTMQDLSAANNKNRDAQLQKLGEVESQLTQAKTKLTALDQSLDLLGHDLKEMTVSGEITKIYTIKAALNRNLSQGASSVNAADIKSAADAITAAYATGDQAKIAGAIQHYGQLCGQQGASEAVKQVKDNITNVEAQLNEEITALTKIAEAQKNNQNKIKSYQDNIKADISSIDSYLTQINNSKGTIAKVQSLNIDSVMANLNSLSSNLDEIKQLPTLLTKNNEAIDQLNTSLQTVSDSMNKKGTDASSMGLVQAIGALNDGAATLASGAQEVSDNYDKIVSGIDTLTSSFGQISSGATALSNGAKTAKAGVDTLNSGAAKLDSGAGTLAKGTKSLATGAATLNSGAKKVNNGTQEVNNGTQTLANGAVKLNNGVKTAVNGVNAVNSGAAKLNTGANTLATGAGTLATGANKVNSGAQQVNSGAGKLNTGVHTLATGANTLAKGMKEYKTSGIDKLTGAAKDIKKDKKLFDQLKKYSDDYKYTATNKDAKYTTRFVTIIENKD